MSASNKSFNVGLLLGMWLLVNVIVATPLTAKSNSIDEQQHGSVQRDRLTSVPMSITQRNNNNNNNITMHALLAQPSEQHGSLEKDESNDLAALLSGMIRTVFNAANLLSSFFCVPLPR